MRRSLAIVAALALTACGGDGSEAPDATSADAAGAAGLCDPTADPGPYPPPDAWEPNHGPGAPAVTFAAEDIGVHCAYLDGGMYDRLDHHNLVVMFDGYLMMPWAPDFAQDSGITLFDISDPCAPVVRGTGRWPTMRETHSIGFSDLGGRWWAAVNYFESAIVGGMQLWDVTDTTAPEHVTDIALPGFGFPDAYARVTLSVFWQGPYLYAASADNGVHIVDAADPTNPIVVGQHVFEPILRAGQVQAVGNLLIVTAAEGPRAVLLDISDPTDPQPIPGGDFLAEDGTGVPREAYFSNTAAGHIFFARKQNGSGLMVYDIRDPQNPTFAGDITNDGTGAYVFVKDDLAFVGEGRFATLYDVADPANITEVERFDLEGDLDTMTPIGNLAVLSVDDEAEKDQGSAIIPWTEEPDAKPPHVTWAWPPDGAAGVATTSRFGVMFNEMVDVKSAFAGSVRLYETGTDPDTTRVDGLINAQEHIVNFTPRCDLAPDTRYTLEIPAGGIVDYNGNAVAEPFTATFTTGPG